MSALAELLRPISAPPLQGEGFLESEKPLRKVKRKNREEPYVISEEAYQTLLGSTIRRKKAPQKYGIRELDITAFNQARYPSIRLEPRHHLEEIFTTNDVFDQFHPPSLVHGFINLKEGETTNKKNAEGILETAVGTINFGPVDDKTRDNLKALKGQEIVVAVKLIEQKEGEIHGVVAPKGIYLEVNPDKATQKNLRQIEGRGIFEGYVTDVDPYVTATMILQQKEIWSRKGVVEHKVQVGTGFAIPKVENAPQIPLESDPIHIHDKVLVPVIFGKDLTPQLEEARGVSVLYTSSRHQKEQAYNEKVIEEKLYELQLLDGLPRTSAADPDKKVAKRKRELIAQLRQNQAGLTGEQYTQLESYHKHMHIDDRPFIVFDSWGQKYVHPHRAQLDQFLLRERKEVGTKHKLIEAHTPAEVFAILEKAFYHNYSFLPRQTIKEIFEEHGSQFAYKDNFDSLVGNVLQIRIDEVKTAKDPQTALQDISALQETLDSKDLISQLLWRSEIMYAGVQLGTHHREWKKSPAVKKLVAQQLDFINGIIQYGNFSIFSDVLRALQPYKSMFRNYRDNYFTYDLAYKPVLDAVIEQITKFAAR